MKDVKGNAKIGPHSRNGKLFHGGSNTPLFRVWATMLHRCNPRYADKYPYYSGRGIKVCPEWNDFIVFRKWATENGYSKGLSIDRIDVNGDYSPKNCRWATSRQQMRNTRRNRDITFNGKTQCVEDWAKEIGLAANSVLERLNTGKPIDQVLSPIKKNRSIPVRCIETGEEFQSGTEAAQKYNLYGCEAIFNSAKSQRPVGGYHWEIIQ